ncbi:MAG: fibronectin type III domain-containing protein [bacterium]
MSDTRGEKFASISGRGVLKLLLVCSAPFLAAACTRLPFDSNTGPIPITVDATSLTLAWETDVITLPGEESPVAYYDVYYREYGRAEWRRFASTAGPRTMITFTSSEVPYGEYEFAVAEVYRDDEESGLHKSSDWDAWPTGGWYVVWRAPKR